MRCPKCGSGDSRVVDSRDAVNAVRRRRLCENCGNRFTTYERVETLRPLVVKRDGTREEWNRTKLLEGVRIACTKRPISSARIEELVDEVEAQVAGSGRQEILTTEIGLAVMRRLRHLDEVAYIRFASVYLRFRDVNGFLEEVERVKRPGRPADDQLQLDL
ncbi:MAG: transcriptional regulator NrdR [Chloroflexota bacterium]|nr:transcriptional regulator NrdR [Chloroflexota bacterium]